MPSMWVMVWLTVLMALTTACGGNNGNQGLPPCAKPPEGIGPDAAATLQVEDKGKAICLHPGDELTVFFSVPLEQESTRWGAISVSDAAVLEPQNAGILTLPRGVTGGVYKAGSLGLAQLTSVRPPCQGADAGCDPGLVWQASVVVKR